MQGIRNTRETDPSSATQFETGDVVEMLFAVCFFVLVATVPLSGGGVRNLVDHRFKALWLLVGALGIQSALATGILALQGEAAAAAHVASCALCFGFLVANRALSGLWVAALGGAVNLVAIAANHGVMPATHSAMAAAGKLPQTAEVANSALVAHPKLLFLGDVFAVPQPLFFASAFSAGDVLIVIGAGVLLHQICGLRPAAQVSSATADANTSEWTSTSAAVV
jgi:hypothetical protein